MKKELSKITCVADMHEIYKKKVPTMFVDYCDSGSWTESTYHNNSLAFNDIYFRQKVLLDVSNRTLKTKLLGQQINAPLIIAPIGALGMQHVDGEILAAQAAKQFGIPFTLSTTSICSIEDVAEATDNHPFWFQLCIMKDRPFMLDLIHRAKKAHCAALVVTVDLPVLGQRHKDIKNGLSMPPKLTLLNILNIMTKPQWCFNLLNAKRKYFGNIINYAKDVNDSTSLYTWMAEQFDPKLSWQDIDWIKQHWSGKLIIKGIMEQDDVQRAIEVGADAIVVSNHGGRQLDGAPATIDVLPELVKTAADKLEIIFDSGIRTGQQALKAIALGADSVMLGRAAVYGLGAYGEDGLKRILQIISNEIDTSMAFCGLRDINQVDAAILR